MASQFLVDHLIFLPYAHFLNIQLYKKDEVLNKALEKAVVTPSKSSSWKYSTNKLTYYMSEKNTVIMLNQWSDQLWRNIYL